MSTFQALDWLFTSPTVFLFTMTFITMLTAFMVTKQLRTSILLAILTIFYNSYSTNDYFTGIVYVIIVVLAYLLANQLYSFIIGGSGTGQEL